MKLLLSALLLMSSGWAYASVETACASKLQMSLDLTLGQFFMEQELNYDDLKVSVSKFVATEKANIYEVEFDNQNGWIYFSKDCKSFRADFGFKSYPEQEI